MRLIGGLALALLIATAVTAAVEDVVVRDGKQTYIHGHHDDDTLERLGDRYASFRLDDVRYVIYDDATLDKIDEAIRPQVEIGKRQGELGAKQGAIGAEQAAIGAQQATIGMEMAFAGSSRKRELGERQRELGEKQRELGERQQELGEKQRELGEKQREASRQAQKELDKIFREAVRTGIARRR